MIAFTILGNPVGKGRPRVTRRGIAFTPEKTRRAEESFLAQALPYKPEMPLAGPLTVDLEFYFSIPASWSKTKKLSASAGFLRPLTKPDLDNLVKLLDALNGVFWIDDSHIVSIRAAKFYSVTPRTEVWISQGNGPLTF